MRARKTYSCCAQALSSFVGGAASRDDALVLALLKARALSNSLRVARLSAISLSFLASSIFSIRRRFCSCSWRSISIAALASSLPLTLFSFALLIFVPPALFAFASLCLPSSISRCTPPRVLFAQPKLFHSFRWLLPCVELVGAVVSVPAAGDLPDSDFHRFRKRFHLLQHYLVFFCCWCCCFGCGAGRCRRAAAARFVFMLGFEDVPTFRNAMPLARAFSCFAFSSSSVIILCCCCGCCDGGGATTLCCCFTGCLLLFVIVVVLNGTIFHHQFLRLLWLLFLCRSAAASCPPETGTVFLSSTTLDASVELFIATIAIAAV